MDPRLLLLLYVGATLLPLGLAWAGARPPRSFWDEMASGAGMLAFSVILVEFVLSGRFQTVSGRIGMDVTMRLHQLLARSALVLALLHPFLYRTPRNPPYPWDVTRQLTITSDFGAIWSGILGWLLLFVLVVLAINRDRIGYRYETWRLTHGLGALVVAGLVLHHTLEAGRYSADPALAAVWIGLAAIAGLTLVHVYAVRPLLQRLRPWRVTGVRPAGLKSWELTIEPKGHRGLAYRAGQFVWLNVGHSPFSLYENPFSIASAPSSGPALTFLIKELGDATAQTGTTTPGTRAHIDGPHGTLTVEGREDAPGIGLIAGGIGIAPLVGILRELRLRGDPRPVTLVYGNRVEEQIVLPDEIARLAAMPATEVVHVLSEPPEGWQGRTGMADAAMIRETFADPGCRSWLYVLCGPPTMMDQAEDTLVEMRVPPSNIMVERFQYD